MTFEAKDATLTDVEGFNRVMLASLIAQHPLPWRFVRDRILSADNYPIAWMLDPVEAQKFIDYAICSTFDLEV